MSEYKEEPSNPGKDDGRCALCKKPGLTEEDRCHGCGYTICEDCFGDDPPWGSHLVVEHHMNVQPEETLDEMLAVLAEVP